MPSDIFKVMAYRFGVPYTRMPETARAVAGLAGLPWTDLDDSETRESGGGGTVTAHGMWRLVKALELLTDAGPDATGQAVAEAADDLSDLGDIEDARLRTWIAVAARRGQPAFREELISIYEGRCAISGFGAVPALEAAHISPYRGPHTNVVQNGLLLRSDIHTLFDLKLIAFHETTREILLAPSLQSSEYADFSDYRLTEPRDRSKRPDAGLLRRHRLDCGL